MHDITWLDDIGSVTLTNLKPSLGTRLADWTPRNEPIGPRAIRLSDGSLRPIEFRTDLSVSFEIRGVPASELSKLLRLQLQLLRGLEVTLTTDNVLNTLFVTCTLAPGTKPVVSFSDTRNLEYTLAVTLIGHPVPLPLWIISAPPISTLECISGLSGVQDFGDDFCPWLPGEYGLPGEYPDGLDAMTVFALDATHSGKYRDPADAAWDNPYSGKGYYDTAFWDGVPEEFRHIDIIQVTTALGGHRAIEAVKYDTDNISSFYSMGPAVDMTATNGKLYTDLWMRMVFQFSAIFPIDNTEGFTDFMKCAHIASGINHTFRLRITKGIKGDPGDASPFPEGDLWYKWQFPSGATGPPAQVGYGTIATRAELMDGTQKEVIIRCRATSATVARFQVWFGDAFTTLDLRLDTTADSAGSYDLPWDMNDGSFFYGEVFGSALTSGQQMSCQLIEWEQVDGSVYDVPPVWGSRLGS